MARKGPTPEPTALPVPQRPWKLVGLGLALAAAGLVMALPPQPPRHRPGPLHSQKPCSPGAPCPKASSEASSEATVATTRQRQEALRRFSQGDPEGAVAALAPLRQTNPSEAAKLGEALRTNWNRNRLEAARAERLAKAGQWSTALEPQELTPSSSMPKSRGVCSLANPRGRLLWRAVLRWEARCWKRVRK